MLLNWNFNVYYCTVFFVSSCELCLILFLVMSQRPSLAATVCRATTLGTLRDPTGSNLSARSKRSSSTGSSTSRTSTSNLPRRISNELRFDIQHQLFFIVEIHFMAYRTFQLILITCYLKVSGKSYGIAKRYISVAVDKVA